MASNGAGAMPAAVGAAPPSGGGCSNPLWAFDAWMWQGVDLRRAASPRYTCGFKSQRAWLLAFWMWRWFAFCYMFAAAAWDWSDQSNTSRHILYLTTVGQWVVVCALFFGLLATTVRLVAPLSVAVAPELLAADKRSWADYCNMHLHRAALVCTNIAAPFQVIIVILYWALVFDSTKARESKDWYATVNEHGVTAAFCFFDVLLSRVRLPDRAALYVFAASVVYLFWNLGFTLANYPLYSVLTWKSSYSAALSIGTLAAIQLFFFIWSLIAWALDACVRRSDVEAAASLPLAAAGDREEVALTAHFARVLYDAPWAFTCSSCGTPVVTPDSAAVEAAAMGKATAKAATATAPVVVVGSRAPGPSAV